MILGQIVVQKSSQNVAQKSSQNLDQTISHNFVQKSIKSLAQKVVTKRSKSEDNIVSPTYCPIVDQLLANLFDQMWVLFDQFLTNF